MPIDFPNSPTNGDTYSAGGKNWQYNGTSWVLQGVVPTIPTGSITESQLAANSVTTAKIAAGAVVEADIATGAVTAGKIASNAVTHDKLHSTLSAVTICTSSTKPASPFDGQVIYMTNVDQTAVWDGSAWVGLDPSRDRNVVINGAMQVAQRGTSTSSITTNGYYTADRFSVFSSSLGTWTQSVENDAPTGSGFRKSLKMLCTTANASPASSDNMRIAQVLEGQNLQHFAKGTASAKQFTFSFWVKSNVTGTYVTNLVDADNSRSVSASYTISASNTWEKKTIIFPADTTGAFDNDNAASLRVFWWLGAGSNNTSGTLNTVWENQTEANRAVGQTNLAAAINNYWQITGVQLEAGAVATPFEFEDHGTTLAKCQRYYFRFSGGNSESIAPHIGSVHTAAVALWAFAHPVAMRSAASSIEVLNLGVFDNQAGVTRSGGTWSLNQAPNSGCTRIIYTHGSSVFTVGQSVFVSTTSATNYFAVSAEL